jgi:anti-sigma factor RsiW
MNSIHQRTAELLPWYVTDTLPVAERDAVEAHIRDCLVCRAALREEQRIRELVRSPNDDRLSPEHGVADLLRKIDGRAGTRRRIRLQPRFAVGIAAAAVVAVAVFVGGALLTPDNPDRTGFSTLSNPAGVAGERIDIVFTEGTDASAIEALVRSFRGRLIGGPTELGRYTVELPTADPAATDALIERLADDPAVRFVGRNFIGEPDAATGTADP